MIWVEILSRHRDVVSRVRIAGEEATIGRGYDNVVIVDDPYVAARHLRVSCNAAGELVAEDMGSANGTFLDGSKDRITRLATDGARPLRIGQTLLRVRTGDYAVEPERRVLGERGALPTAMVAALTVIVFGFVMLRVWLAQTGEPRLSNYMTPLLTLSGVVLVWVGIWARLAPSCRTRAIFTQPCHRAGRLPRHADLQRVRQIRVLWTDLARTQRLRICRDMVDPGRRVLYASAGDQRTGDVAEGHDRGGAYGSCDRSADATALGVVL